MDIQKMGLLTHLSRRLVSNPQKVAPLLFYISFVQSKVKPLRTFTNPDPLLAPFLAISFIQ
jgi:hypothetical protein